MGDIRQKLSKRYPEIERFDSHQAASDAMKAWSKALAKMPLFWLSFGGVTGGAAACGTLVLVVVQRWIDVSPSMQGGVVGGVVGGSTVVVSMWFWRRRCQRFLRDRLIALGVPICLKCGYDLRGQTEPRCPECGTPFDLSSVRPKDAAAKTITGPAAHKE